MKTLKTLSAGLAAFVVAVLISAAPARAEVPCSLHWIVGNWMFATDVGQQMLFPGIDGDITAIGTMNIDSAGNVVGLFDATVAEYAFLPDNTYTGSVTLNRDCTGTLSFVTSSGTSRTDTIVIVGDGSEILGMSQDPLNLWTYVVKRVSGRR